MKKKKSKSKVKKIYRSSFYKRMYDLYCEKYECNSSTWNRSEFVRFKIKLNEN